MDMKDSVKGQVEDVLTKSMDLKQVEYVKNCLGGMVNQNAVFDTDNGKLFVKMNQNIKQARVMFEGEMESLRVLDRAGVARLPHPYKVLDLPNEGCLLVMEYLDTSPLSIPSEFTQLGKQIAQLHLYNGKGRQYPEKSESKVHQDNYQNQFGFHTVTSCGLIIQDTSWTDNWLEYWARKMEKQMSLIEKNFEEVEVCKLWNELVPKLPAFFKDIEVTPCLLHGDLWDKNLGVHNTNQEIVLFDPGCFYGHSEFDLSLPSLCDEPMWEYFFDSYHSIIPKSLGFETRRKLYQLYHHVNHWNHFPPKSGQTTDREDRCLAISTLKELLVV